MATMNVSLPDPMREWVEEQVRSGDYSNASDYFRDLIRRDRERRDWLVHALIEGEASGISERSVKRIMTETKAGLRNGKI